MPVPCRGGLTRRLRGPGVGVRDLVRDRRVAYFRTGLEQDGLVSLGIGDEDRSGEDAGGGHHRTFAVMWMSGT